MQPHFYSDIEQSCLPLDSLKKEEKGPVLSLSRDECHFMPLVISLYISHILKQ